MKRIISLILVIAMLLPSAPVSMAASTLFVYASSYAAYNNDFYAYLTATGVPTSIPHPKGVGNLNANKSTYDKYGLIVYGIPEDVVLSELDAGLPRENIEADELYNGDEDDPTGTRGYRYLGYAQNEEVVTNTYYPPDAAASDTSDWIKEYTDVEGAKGTWDVVVGTIKSYMTSHWIAGNGINTGDTINTQYAVETINNTRSMTALNQYAMDGVSGSYARTKLLTTAGWFSNFSIRTERGRYYQTWLGESLADNGGFSIDQTLTVASTFTIKADANAVDVPIAYFVKINPNAYMKPEDVQKLNGRISIQDTVQKEVAVQGVYTNSLSTTVSITRSGLAIGDNTLTVKGDYLLITTYANDNPYGDSKEKVIHVIVEAPVDPAASCTVTANPRYALSSGDDIDVSVKVDVSLYNITPANVQSIAVWLEGECKYATVDNPAVTFNRSIDGTPFDDDPEAKVEKTWRVTTNVNLKDGRQIQATDSDITIVTGEAKPPIVKVKAPASIKAGNSAGVSVRARSSVGIATLILNDANTGDDICVESDDYLNYLFTFQNVGTQKFEGVAIDVFGNAGYGEDETVVEVLPPTVEAALDVSGSLKPYRAIAVSTDRSSSPVLYPIVDAQTDWRITSGTVNAASGVYAPSDPDGSRSFTFGVPAAGTINAAVTLKNTLGYTGTASETITIAPDLPPVAEMEINHKVYRDPQKSNAATITIANMTESIDGDAIGRIEAYYWYDSDNDGDYFEHPYHLIHYGANDKTLSFDVASVGKYYIRLDAYETYTPMPGMAGSAVYQSDSTYEGYIDEKYVVEVANIAPAAQAEYVANGKAINVVVQLGDSTASEATINSYLNNTLKAELESKGNTLKSTTVLSGGSDLVFDHTEEQLLLRPCFGTSFQYQWPYAVFPNTFLYNSYIFNVSEQKDISSAEFYAYTRLIPNSRTLAEYQAMFDSTAEFNKSGYEYPYGLNVSPSSFVSAMALDSYYTSNDFSSSWNYYKAPNEASNVAEGSIYIFTHYQIRGGDAADSTQYYGGSYYLSELTPDMQIVEHIIIDWDEYLSYGLNSEYTGYGSNDYQAPLLKGVVGHDDWFYIPSFLMRRTRTGYIYSNPKVFDTTTNTMMNAPAGLETYYLTRFVAPSASKQATASDIDGAGEKSYVFGTSVGTQISITNIDPVYTSIYSNIPKLANIKPVNALISKESGELATDDVLYLDPQVGTVYYRRDSTNLNYTEDTYYNFFNMDDYSLDTFHEGMTFKDIDYTNRTFYPAVYVDNGSTGLYNTHMSRYFFNSAYYETLKNHLATCTINPNEKTYYIMLDGSGMPYMREGESGKISALLSANAQIDFMTDSMTAYASEWLAASDGTAIAGYAEIGSAILSDLAKAAEDSDTVYVLKDELINFNLFFTDYENDAFYDYLIHTAQIDPDCFDHVAGDTSEGISLKNNTDIHADSLTLDKIGKYLLTLKVRDNPVGTNDALDAYRLWSEDNVAKTVYVHRKPIADGHIKYLFNLATGLYENIEWVDDSYDPDHQVTLVATTRGIQQTLFAYRVYGDSEWQQVLPSTLAPGTYEVRLFAQDVEGAWSDETIKCIELSATPAIQFDATLKTADSANLLTAFKPNNDILWTSVWTRYPYAHHLELSLFEGAVCVTAIPYKIQNTGYSVSGQDRYWQDISMTLPVSAGLADKTYQARIEAVSDVNGERAVIEGDVTIDTNEPPTIDGNVSPATIYVGQSANLSFAVSDPNAQALSVGIAVRHEGILYAQQTLTASPSGSVYMPILWTLDDLPAGSYTVSATVSDGLLSASKTLSFTVQPFRIASFDVIGAWNHWDGRVDYRGVYLTPDPHRFLSLETVTFRAVVEGMAETVQVTLSPELMAMTYTDPYGNVYDYEDIVGDRVSFPLPLAMTAYDEASSSGIWEANYILPLAPSTLSWEDIRQRGKYEATLTAIQGTAVMTATIDDIEITGNIYDRISLQPVYD